MELLSRSFFNKRANCHFYRPPSRVVLTLLLPLLVLFIPLSVISVVTCHVAVTSGEEGDDRAPREAVGDWSLADEHHPRGTAGLLDTSGAAARRLIIDGTILADSQLQVLVALNAAWQLWPSNSNRSRRCDQWYFVQCNQQGFITTLYVTLALGKKRERESASTMWGVQVRCTSLRRRGNVWWLLNTTH